MKNYFSVYVTLDCEESRQALNFLDEKGVPFMAVVMDKNPEFHQMILKDMNLAKTPVVVEHLENSIKIIGGLENLKNYLSQNKD